MIYKQPIIFTCLFLAISLSMSVASTVYAIPTSPHLIGLAPPEYLSVPGWQQCVSSKTRGAAEFICLPPVKPEACAPHSWEQLKRKQLIPAC